MEEKQKEQMRIVASVLDSNPESLRYLKEAWACVSEAVRFIVKDLSAYDVLEGYSHEMLAASALVGLKEQLDSVIKLCKPTE